MPLKIKTEDEPESKDEVFAGVVIDQENEETPEKPANGPEQTFDFKGPIEEVKPLKMKRLTMSPDGKLKISFSKPILPIAFAPQSSENSENRRLQVLLDNAITLAIEGDEDVEVDKSIASVQVVDI